MNIVFLYSELVGYTQSILDALVEYKPDTMIDAVYWDHKKKSGYQLESRFGITFHKRSTLRQQQIFKLLKEKQPSITVVSGWMDKDYLKALRRYKQHNHQAIVISGIDNQWNGSVRQRASIINVKLFYKSLFDFVWVAGKPQYSYVQKLGFNADQIIHNLYSANTSKLNKYVVKSSQRFVFSGRFAREKGVVELAQAYASLPLEVRKNWPLVLIGDGYLRSELENIHCPQITIKGFLQSETLVEELSKGGVYVAPSHRENWGVSIHEMAVLGYPMVLSKICGAGTEFLISGYNGFNFKDVSISSIKQALLRVTDMDANTLVVYGKRSKILGSKINPELTAASLFSTLPRS